MNEMFPALLVPRGWPGEGPVVSLLIPECELQLVGTDLRAVVNRPRVNKVVAFWLNAACEMAREQKAALILCCDSRAELDGWIARAEAMLPRYRARRFPR